MKTNPRAGVRRMRALWTAGLSVASLGLLWCSAVAAVTLEKMDAQDRGILGNALTSARGEPVWMLLFWLIVLAGAPCLGWFSSALRKPLWCLAAWLIAWGGFALGFSYGYWDKELPLAIAWDGIVTAFPVSLYLLPLLGMGYGLRLIYVALRLHRFAIRSH